MLPEMTSSRRQRLGFLVPVSEQNSEIPSENPVYVRVPCFVNVDVEDLHCLVKAA